jgi:hypothetical protein
MNKRLSLFHHFHPVDHNNHHFLCCSALLLIFLIFNVSSTESVGHSTKTEISRNLFLGLWDSVKELGIFAGSTADGVPWFNESFS